MAYAERLHLKRVPFSKINNFLILAMVVLYILYITVKIYKMYL